MKGVANLVAHSNPEFPRDVSKWEPLVGRHGHIHQVAWRARCFGHSIFRHLPELSPLAGICGRWHDLGKFSDAFQNYIRQAACDAHTGETQGRVDHSTAGAQHAMSALPPPLNAMVAYAIAGHHAGLLDAVRAEGGSLQARLAKQDLPPWREAVPENLLRVSPLSLPTLSASNRADAAFQLGFATRMLFSCLVDADFLATESFMSPRRAAERPKGEIDFGALEAHLTRYLDECFGTTAGLVAEARAAVLSACREKALGVPGLYDLTVPTGGGKTLSSLAFALRHCVTHGLSRVIYAIPFTSIIEQTAEVFRSVFKDCPADPDALILEHHSNFDPDRETTRSRLASENWDAPLIVTTNVQLFESLFANRPGRCRKLHRIANSVIILDEAQTLPVTLLKPCLRVLDLLVKQYGCTVVLCTATQPAIEYREEEFEIGLPKARPIIDDAPALYRRLRRVEVRDAGTLSSEELAVRMADAEQGLAIVNTRRHAVDLYQAVKDKADADGAYHLSAAMTPEHRSRQLEEIRSRLAKGQACRVVATQLIEAGVDVDFPVVWRALAGLDSIAQAAGRCNREGMRSSAITWIFRPGEADHARLFGLLRTGADAASQVIGTGRYEDLIGLDAVEHYFRLHYWVRMQDWDRHDICGQFRVGDPHLPLAAQFATAAEKFRFIDQTQRPVVVGWDDRAREMVGRLRVLHDQGLYPDRRLARHLQRQTVTVPERLWRQALADGKIELLCERFAVLVEPALHYDLERGLQLEADSVYDPASLIVE
ncbi:MAG TPA: CRISPR-associated helicase Cas3' [Gammaproteobacteria bacterium]|nr:CRISPR-associated helicase Cas3' [Gammaproteobacteria bacterium]